MGKYIEKHAIVSARNGDSCDTGKLIVWLCENDRRFSNGFAGIRAGLHLVEAVERSADGTHVHVADDNAYALIKEAAMQPQIPQQTAAGIQYIGAYPWKPAYELHPIIDRIENAKSEAPKPAPLEAVEAAAE